jgi:CheY-like chemotaxis protein
MTKVTSTRRRSRAKDPRRSKPGILLVEDDLRNARDVAKALATWGFHVHLASSVGKARRIARKFPRLRFVGLDMNVPNEDSDTDGGRSGLVLLRELSDILPKAKIYMKSSTGFTEEAKEFIKLYNKSVVRFGPEWDAPLMAQKAGSVYSSRGMRPTVFIVHGHASDALEQLRRLIKDELRLGDPVIMKDAAGGIGHAIIEKFEEYAARADLVFALLTPDDETDAGLHARQNVIFEIGYFAAALGRKSGRLIVLHHQKALKPSDIDGLLTIDITGGVHQAADKIRQELKGWWGIEEAKQAEPTGNAPLRRRRSLRGRTPSTTESS